MEFTKYKCPVCDKHFVKSDDVVVCPECGTPHHRECYENEGHCFYENKHCDNFSFDEADTQKNEDIKNSYDNIVVCKNCNTENPKENFYCYKCSAPLNEVDAKKDEQNRQTQQNNQPFGNAGIPPFGVPYMQNNQTFNPFDPMAGLKNDEPVAENVNAGEMSKFVGKNTQYFLRIFNTINKFKSSRFNFSAFLFSGIYFLYRKMLVLGIVFSGLIICLTAGQLYIQMMPSYQEIYNTISNILLSGQRISFTNIPGVSSQELFFFLLPTFLNIIRLAIMIISGAIANKTYYKHCTKKINSIKQSNNGIDINKTLEAKGGVNLPLAICIGIAYIAISYIPLFI